MKIVAITTCPKCRATNWVCEGDVLVDDDGTRYSCWQCKQKTPLVLTERE